MAFIRWDRGFHRLQQAVEDAIGVPLRPDLSGRFEEFPAVVGKFLDIEVALLDNAFAYPAEHDQFHTYQISLQSGPDSLEDQPLPNIPDGQPGHPSLSKNLIRVLRQAGFMCEPEPPEGDHTWFIGA